MLELAAFRLREQLAPKAGFEFVEPVTGRVVGIASQDAEEVREPGPVIRAVGFVLNRIRWIMIPIAMLWMVGAILGLWRISSSRQPRLIVRRAGRDEVLFEVENALGLMYDARKVYDGQGRAIARFEGRFKTTVRGGFGIVDLVGEAADAPQAAYRPWLGHVEPADGGYRFDLVRGKAVGRITPSDPPAGGAPADPRGLSPYGAFDVEARPELHDEAEKLLLLAAALTVAWRPPA